MKAIKTISNCTLIIAVVLLQSCAKKNEHEGHKMVMDSMTTMEVNLLDVTASTNRFVISNQGTVKPIYSGEQNIISADGYIAEDIRRNRKVSTRVSGRIEKLYVRYNYQYVKKGEKIMEIYSPDLNTYLEEYLFLKRNGDSLLLETAKQKLLLLGVRESQLNRIQKKDSVGLTIEILSPSEGYIIFGSSSPMSQKASTQASSEMGNMTSRVNETPSYPVEERIREGSYINAGETLFNVNDFKEVWAILSFRAQDQTLIKPGVHVALHSELLLMDTLHVSINFIEPLYENDQNFLQARVYIKNAQVDLKPNSILTAQVTPSKTTRLLLPQSSILHLGKQNIAWVKSNTTKGGNSIFEAKVILLGAEMNGFVEVISGINAKDEVAREAGYLMDSQSLVILK